MPPPRPAAESFADLHFPLSGIDVSTAYDRQPVRAGQSGQYARTTPEGVNVRAFEPSTNRARGAQRSGLSKYLAARVNGAALVQGLDVVVGVGYNPPGGVMQSSQSGRVVTLVAVSGGGVFAADAGSASWSSVTNGAAALNSTGVVLSAANNQKLWFADGTHWVYYDPSDNAMHTWVATSGELPRDTAHNAPRLIATWRGRTVLSGLLLDPQNWFMSAVSDPTDFNYAPFEVSSAQAVCGNNGPLGLVGDVVTCMIPYTDDVLVMGCDHSIFQFAGDPMAGGQIDLVSDSIGMAWGQPWCKGPDGALYFFSNRTGIYSMVPGQGPPVRISQPIEALLQETDTGASTVRMIWDDRFQGLHVFVTPTAAAAAATHYFWEMRTGAWWTDVFADNDHNPLCCVVFDGNDPGDRAPLIGSWDGYVRAVDPDATDDDGTPIASSVVLGPILTPNLDDMMLKDVQGVLATASGDVAYAVHVGATAEAALASAPVSSGTWSAGRNLLNMVRRSGHAVYVRLTASAPWALEAVRCRVAAQGKVRRRGV